MRAIQYHEHGGPDVLSVEEVDRRELYPNEILISVEAFSVNPMDTYFREGNTHTRVQPPVIPGSDCAGVVEAVGPGVTAYEPGDRVLAAGLFFHRHGTYAEYTVAPLDRIAPLPADVSFENGAGVGHAGLTAWRAICRYGDVAPGYDCLIHGGSGGVGHLAVQLAAIAGTSVAATAGSEMRRERVRELGASAVFDYGRSDLHTALEDAAHDGYETIVDHLPEEYLELDIDLAADFGDVVLIDGYDVRASNLRQTRRTELTIQSIGAASHTEDMPKILGILGRLLAEGTMEVDVARTYPLSETTRAHRDLMNESYVGKLVVTP